MRHMTKEFGGSERKQGLIIENGESERGEAPLN
jgi:hypothetical protein